jgi:hypothetical protein
MYCFSISKPEKKEAEREAQPPSHNTLNKNYKILIVNLYQVFRKNRAKSLHFPYMHTKNTLQKANEVLKIKALTRFIPYSSQTLMLHFIKT